MYPVNRSTEINAAAAAAVDAVLWLVLAVKYP